MSQRFLATCLRIEIDGANKHWLESRPAMSAACEKLDSMVDDVIRRYGASRHERLERGAILAFIDSLAAVEAAAALVFMVEKELWTTRDPIQLKVAVRTGMIESRRTGVAGQILDLCAAQLQRTAPGQATVCETTSALVRKELPPDIELEEAGRVKLNDCTQAERLYWLNVAGATRQFRSAVSRTESGHNIPPRLTSFVGRDDELEDLERRVRSNRFLSVVGPGGAGKTSLCQELARRFSLEMPDGAWFIGLAHATTSLDIARETAATMSTLLQTPFKNEESLFVEIGDRSLLLVLDNLEQALRPAARFIHKLLTFCPNVRVLATSRRPVGAAGEHVHPIEPFTLPSATEAIRPGDLIRYAAIRLFVDRAAAVEPGFALTESNGETVYSICKRVEGLPLAIEHAASQVRRLSLGQIDRTLETSLLALGSSRDDLDPRQSTLRATARWSLDLLSPMARTLASTLTAFVGGWNLEACAAVARGSVGMSESGALEAHGELFEASVVHRDQTSGVPRFRFSEAFRQALLELSPVPESAIRAHASYFADFAHRSDVEMVGPRQAEWFTAMHLEADNLRVALQRTWDDRPLDAAPFVSGLRRFWLRGREHQVAIHWIENALSVAGMDRAEIRAQLLNALGACHYRIGQWKQAERYFEEYRFVSRELDKHEEVAAALTNLALCRAESGDIQGAVQICEESCRLYESCGEHRGLGSALMNLGYMQSRLGSLEEAEATLKLAAEALEPVGHSAHLCMALGNQSHVAWKKGDRSAYMELVKRQIDLIAANHDSTSLVTVALGIAACATESGHLDAARASLDLLHDVSGGQPTFNHRLHEEQYQQALLFVGPECQSRRSAVSELDWDDRIESIRKASAAFATAHGPDS